EVTVNRDQLAGRQYLNELIDWNAGTLNQKVWLEAYNKFMPLGLPHATAGDDRCLTKDEMKSVLEGEGEPAFNWALALTLAYPSAVGLLWEFCQANSDTMRRTLYFRNRLKK